MTFCLAITKNPAMYAKYAFEIRIIIVHYRYRVGAITEMPVEIGFFQ